MRMIQWVLGGALAAGACVAGCASNDHAGHQHHEAMMGMACPKCETTWVGPHAQAGGSPKTQALHWGRGEVCPDCDAMAEAYFKDGEKVLHNCPTCNVTPRATTPYTPSHPKGTHG
jgi:hypothetical protein